MSIEVDSLSANYSDTSVPEETKFPLTPEDRALVVDRFKNGLISEPVMISILQQDN